MLDSVNFCKKFYLNLIYVSGHFVVGDDESSFSINNIDLIVLTSSSCDQCIETFLQYFL
jgi:hypothetical protein